MNSGDEKKDKQLGCVTIHDLNRSWKTSGSCQVLEKSLNEKLSLTVQNVFKLSPTVHEFY